MDDNGGPKTVATSTAGGLWRILGEEKKKRYIDTKKTTEETFQDDGGNCFARHEMDFL